MLLLILLSVSAQLVPPPPPSHGARAAGAVSAGGAGPRRDDARRAGHQHPHGHQLPGLAAQEALEELPIPARQVHHGTALAAVLICSGNTRLDDVVR